MSAYDPTWAIILDGLAQFMTEIDSQEQDEQFCDGLFDSVFRTVSRSGNKMTLNLESERTDEVITVVVVAGHAAIRDD